MSDLFHTTALKLSTFRRSAIVQATFDQPALRRAALQLHCKARGPKLGRRLRRKTQLDRRGAF